MRSAVAGLVLGITLAVGAPAAWVLTRPPAAAGAPVAEVLGPADRTAAGGPAPSPPAADLAEGTPPAAAPPVRVRVPALAIDAPVDAVGVAPDGQMALPDDVGRVGWYRFGPAPGTTGSAVLAGHVDDRVQGLGALAPLREAAVGQEVLVTDGGGADSRWRVVGRQLLSKQGLPVAEIFGRSGAPRLTLVTCGGPFLPETGGYRDNVVVVAVPAD